MRRAAVVLVVVGLSLIAYAQPPAEGALGAYPVPEIVGMSGEPRSVVLIRAVVEGSEHEWLDGSGNIGALTISAQRGSVPLMLLKDLRGETVDVILRVVEKPALQEVRR